MLPPIGTFASRPHGTRIRYMTGCRCVPCRAANSRYSVHRAQEQAKGRSNGIVPAGAVKAHVRALSRKGMGYKRVADTAGVARSTVSGILQGRRKNLRAASERAILAVTFAPSRATLVNAASTWKLLDALITDGYPKVRIARWLGQRGTGLQMGRNVVTYRNALKVRALYRQLTAEARTA